MQDIYFMEHIASIEIADKQIPIFSDKGGKKYFLANHLLLAIDFKVNDIVDLLDNVSEQEKIKAPLMVGDKSRNGWFITLSGINEALSATGTKEESARMTKDIMLKVFEVAKNHKNKTQIPVIEEKSELSSEQILSAELANKTILGHMFTVYGTVKNPFVKATDIATAIHHCDVTNMVRGLEDGTQRIKQTLYIANQNRDTWLLSQSGVKILLTKSRKTASKILLKELLILFESLKPNPISNIANTISFPTNDVQVLQKSTILGREFIVYGTPEKPLFLAKDVAKWLEHTNPAELIRTVDEDEKLSSTILRGGQKREVSFLTENGLYEVLMQSRKPVAKEFKTQVKKILVEIREKGGYSTVRNQGEMIVNALSTPESLIVMLSAYRDERDRANELSATVDKLNDKVAQDAPKVKFADALSDNPFCITLGDFAKILNGKGIDIGRTRLFGWMRENGYLVKSKTKNIPTQRSMEQQLFKVEISVKPQNDGPDIVMETPKLTTKGQQYFISELLKIESDGIYKC